MERGGVTYYFVDNEQYFARPELYGYYDDGERFAFFSRAVVSLLVHLDFIPDIVHCNDWQTAAIPYLLRSHDEPITERFRDGLQLAEVAVWETPTSVAYYHGS